MKMEATTSIKPKTMAELLPGLTGILSKDDVLTLTAKKQPRQTVAQARTTEKVFFKPLTIAEMSSEILALNGKSRRPVQSATSVKKNWNSSVKVDKKISHTANGQMKNSNVRKVLNFQPKPKNITNSRITTHQASETPKFPKPEFRAKKSILQARNNVRISGIANIPETPLINKPLKSWTKVANKENYSNQTNITKKQSSPQTIPLKLVPDTPVIAPVHLAPDTPFSNQSWKSSCDASFLQKEKEINDIEAKTKVVSELHNTQEKQSEVSPSVSTPFKEYRDVQDYFNNSSELESSALYNDNTIMCFDKPSLAKENNKREESVIISLCELLNKATVTTNDKTNTEINELLQIEKQTEHNINMIENAIKALKSIKEAQWKSLQYVRKLINEKNGQVSESEKNDKTLIDAKLSPNVLTEKKSANSPILGQPCSVIKTCIKSPSYKIPKKNLCLRKKVFYKSMPNVSNGSQSPSKAIDGRALNMYMKMKEQMNFLHTPLVKYRNTAAVPDTPAVTSSNLRRQLDKLYGGS